MGQGSVPDGDVYAERDIKHERQEENREMKYEKSLATQLLQVVQNTSNSDEYHARCVLQQGKSRKDAGGLSC